MPASDPRPVATSEPQAMPSHAASTGPAASAAAANDNDLQAIVSAVRAATGKTGAALYKPLRLALTGRTHGPELAPLLKAMPPGKARERLARFAA